MKKYILAVCMLLLVLGWGRALACNNSDMDVTSCVYNTGTSQWDIAVRVNVGSGITGNTTGGDGRTTTFGFFFYWSCWDTIYSFSPAAITGTYTNCQVIGQKGILPAFQGSQAYVRYIQGGAPCAANNPFACITPNLNCGPARSEPYNFTFHLATLPDSFRCRGVEGAGNYLGGCSQEPDMLADFRQIACPGTQQLVVDNACSAILPDYRSLTSTLTPCGGGTPTIAQSPAPGAVLSSAGPINITMTATYFPGVFANCSFQTSVLDTTLPTIACPANATLALNSNCQIALPSYVSQATATDNCTVTVTQSPSAGTLLTGSGTTTVTLTATDASGNVAACALTVTHQDQTPPSVLCPASFAVSPVGLTCDTALTWSSTATDNCGATVTSTPASGSSFAVGVTTVTSIATDAAGNTSTCSFSVTVIPPSISGTTTTSDPNPCNGDTVTLGNSIAANSYLWSTGATTPTLQVTVSGSYWVELTGVSGCMARDTILVTFSTDCVWPGDANHDGIADNQDLLAVGLGFGFSGFTRPGASGLWDGQPSPDWATSLPSLVNHKHTDCDGNGTIDFVDTTLIIANYGLTHLKATGTTAGIPLYIVPERDSFPAGDSVFFNIYWGNVNEPVVNGHGLAFSYHVDATQITPGTFYMRYLNSFLGNVATEMLTLTYPETAGSNWHIGVSRKDGVSQNGSGAIARVGFLPAQVYPLTQTLGYIPVRLSNAMAVDEHLNPIMVATMDDSILIYSIVIGQDPLKPLVTWGIHPNPTASRAVLDLQLGAAAQVEATLIDLQGRHLQTILAAGQVQAGATQVAIETSSLSTGMYFIRLEIDGRSVSRKFVVQH
jgi:HYR domain/Secretion system C-terminal sorting domain